MVPGALPELGPRRDHIPGCPPPPAAWWAQAASGFIFESEPLSELDEELELLDELDDDEELELLDELDDDELESELEDELSELDELESELLLPDPLAEGNGTFMGRSLLGLGLAPSTGRGD